MKKKEDPFKILSNNSESVLIAKVEQTQQSCEKKNLTKDDNNVESSMLDNSLDKQCLGCLEHKKTISTLKSTISLLQSKIYEQNEDIRRFKKENLGEKIKFINLKMKKNKEIKNLKKQNSQAKVRMENLEKEIERKEKIIKENIKDSSKHGSKKQLKDKQKKKLENIKSKLLKDNIKPLKKEINHTQKELKKKEKEIKALQLEVSNLENQINNNNEQRERKKNILSIFGFQSAECKEDISDFGLDNYKSIVPVTSNFMVSKQNKLDGLIKEKNKLNEKVNELTKIKDIFTDKKMINFFYGNSQKDVRVRSYIGFTIKETIVSEASENEINFFKQVFKSELESNSNKKKNSSNEKKLFENNLKKEEINRIVKCYGFWKSKKKYEDFYCIALERGKCDLKSFLLQRRNETQADLFQFQKIETSVQNTAEWNLNLMREICYGVRVLHQNGIAHNDIKPENILICEDIKNSSFSIKMMDFENVDKIPCIFTGLKGTANYMCPNIIELENGKEDKFSLERDIFSLGVVLVFVLFKQNVFQDLLELLRKKVSSIFSMNSLPYILCECIKNGKNCREMEILKKLRDENDEKVKELWIKIEKCRKEKNYFYIFKTEGKNEIFDSKNYLDLKKEIISCFSMIENKRSNIFNLIKTIDSCLNNLKKKEIEHQKNTKENKILKEIRKKKKVFSTFSCFKKPVEKWKKKEIIQWLYDVNILKNDEYKFFLEVEGKELLEMQESDLLSKGIESQDTRKKILEEIDYLKEHGYNFNETRVLKKIKRMNVDTDKESYKIAKCLSNESELMNSYFKLCSKWNDIFESKSESDKMNDRKTGSFPLKLVVTELHLTETQKKFRKVFSPFLAQLKDFSKEFGIFHTSIICGPWYLEWLDNSLVIPRKLQSSMALLTADIEATSFTKKLSMLEIKKKLAKVIVKWNTSMTYCNLKKDENSGNCQDFVEEVMEVLDVSLNKGGCFGKFLEKMKLIGKCEMIFSPSSNFKRKFIVEKEIKFDTHEELDIFVGKCFEIDEIAFQFDFQEEKKLLKSFDRAFWLRHLKKPNAEKFKPGNLNGKGCPFKDPRMTKSFLVLPNDNDVEFI